MTYEDDIHRHRIFYVTKFHVRYNRVKEKFIRYLFARMQLNTQINKIHKSPTLVGAISNKFLIIFRKIEMYKLI